MKPAAKRRLFLALGWGFVGLGVVGLFLPVLQEQPCHAHPTLNEAVKEAALAVDDRSIHI